MAHPSKDGYIAVVQKILEIFPAEIERKTFRNELTPLYISLQLVRIHRKVVVKYYYFCAKFGHNFF